MLRKKNDVEEAPLGDELMLFEPESSRFFVLNPSMALVWKNLDQQNEEAIAAMISESFTEIESDKAATDVRTAIGQLETMGLLEKEAVNG